MCFWINSSRDITLRHVHLWINSSRDITPRCVYLRINSSRDITPRCVYLWINSSRDITPRRVYLWINSPGDITPRRVYLHVWTNIGLALTLHHHTTVCNVEPFIALLNSVGRFFVYGHLGTGPGNIIPPTSTFGWSDFLRRKNGHLASCANCFRAPILKFTRAENSLIGFPSESIVFCPNISE